MKYREFGRTGWKVSEISFGSWAIGGTWGNVDDNDSLKALHKAVDLGVNFFDTADVYGDGRSERLLAKLKENRNEEIYIATKVGRKLNPHVADGYNKTNLENFVDINLKNLNTDCIDLLQLHCPPTEVYYMPKVFGVLDDFVKAGKIRYYGVSVEKVEEGLKALEYPNVQSVQIIFNMFRHRPAELFFEQALKKRTAILARVPLASGMLTGKMSKTMEFEQDDHRSFNRNGEMFDKGETFSGVDYNLCLKAVDEIKNICPKHLSITQFALKWILMFPAVTCAIPGAKNENQVTENASVSDMNELDDATLLKVEDIYKNLIREQVHHLW